MWFPQRNKQTNNYTVKFLAFQKTSAYEHDKKTM